MLKSNKYGVETPITYAGFLSAIPRCLEKVEVRDHSFERALMSVDDGLMKARKLFMAAHKKNRKVIFIGNGGSGAIASHMAIDYSKNAGIRAVAFNDHPTLTCLANDFGYDQVFAKQIEFYAQKGDVLVVVSTSGRSKNILAGASAGRNHGCEIVTFSGMQPDNFLRQAGCINFYVPSNDYGLVEISHLILLHAIASISMHDNTPLVEADIA